LTKKLSYAYLLLIKARFEKKFKAAAKAQKAAAKLELMQARQVVREGPLQV
jgi:hypothetical protein